MKSRLLLLLLLTSIAFTACRPHELELPNVPIYFGMRINDQEDAAQLNPNLSQLRQMVFRRLVIELPLVADSSGLPKLGMQLPKESSGLLRTYRNELVIAFATTNEESLFPAAKLADPVAWFARLDSLVMSEMAVVSATMPTRVIFGSDLAPTSAQLDLWKQYLKKWRSAYPEVKFSIGGRLEALNQSGFAAISDELVIDYPPLVGDDLKSQSRELTSQISDFAIAQNLPVFVYRANIIGPNETAQIKNRLRFWHPNVRLQGICINTLSGKIAARDSVTYYGLADHPESLEYLQQYRLGN